MEKALKKKAVSRKVVSDDETRERIKNSAWYKRMVAIWGPPVKEIPAHISVLFIPATCPREEGGMQSGPTSPWKALSAHEDKCSS